MHAAPHRSVRPARRGLLLVPSVLIAILLSLAAPERADAQSVSDQLTRLADDNARRYLHPVSSGLGATLGSGHFAAATAGDGLSIRVGLQASGGLIPTEDKTFDPVLPAEVTYRDRTFTDPYAVAGGRTTTPTAAGEGTGVELEPAGDFRQAILQAGEDPADFRIPFPDGFDLPGVPLVTANAVVGLPTGTSVTGSVLPEIEVSGDVGSLSSLGVGVRQSLTHFAGDPPVDVAVAASYQQLALGDVVDATGQSASVIVSRSIAPLTLFASGSVESSSVDAEYTFENPGDNPGQPADGTTIAFEDEGENSTSFTAGLRFDVSAVGFTASYTLASYPVLRAGLSFGS